MNRLGTFALVALLLSSVAAEAQIGCTPEQCKNHYGEASDLESYADGSTKKCTFNNPSWGSTGGHYIVYVSFSDGKCDCISYIGQNGITSKQAKILLQLNANGYIWTQTNSTSKAMDYSAHLDGKVSMQAFYAPGKSQLMIGTSEWWQRNQ